MIVPNSYCYWSVCRAKRQLYSMEPMHPVCRMVGVFRNFRIFSNVSIPDAICYGAADMNVNDDRIFLVYLSAGVKKLDCEYVIWLNADTKFLRMPGCPLMPLGISPIHVPLMRTLRNRGTDRRLYTIYKEGGVSNCPYLPVNGFWILKIKALDHVCSLAAHIIAIADNMNMEITGDEALGYAGQMLCGDPERHLVSNHVEIWGRKGIGKWRKAAIVSGLC